jgi:hypothetical protein
MLLDQQNVFFDGNLAAATANLSDVIDMGAPVDLATLNGLGDGPMEVFVRTGTEGNVDNTLALTLVGADNEAMTTNPINITVQAAADIGGNGQIKRLAIPHHTPKRFFRLTATTAGTTSTNTGFKAFLKGSVTQRSLAGSPALI